MRTWRNLRPHNFFIEVCFIINYAYLCGQMLTNSEIISLLRREKNNFAPEAKITLFGSRARGDNRDDSDVDLLVLLPDTYDSLEFAKRQIEISRMLYDISLDNGIDIMPIILLERIYYERKTPFTLNVDREGIKI